MSNIVIELRISLSNFEFHYRILSFESHSVFVWTDGDIFENPPRMDADLF